jgi:hypothetical protein
MNSQPPSDPRPPRNRPLGFDEIIAIIIVLLTMGTVFWVTLPRRDMRLLSNVDLETPLFKLDDSVSSGVSTQNQPEAPRSSWFQSQSQTPTPAETTGPQTSTGSTSTTAKPAHSFSSVFLTMFGLSSGSQLATTTEAKVVPSPEATLTPVPTTAQTPIAERTESAGVPVPVPVPVPVATASPTPTTPTPTPTSTPTLVGETPETPNPSAQPTLALPLEEKAREENPQAKVTFSDIPQGYWARPMIIALAQRGILTGFPDGTFRPNQPVTRAEFATMIQKTFAAKKMQQRLQFKDVASDFWALPQINEATETGFMRGYPNNTFEPAQNIPRVQVLVSLVNGLGLKAKNEPAKALQGYQDAASIPQYAADEVAAATELGLQYSNPDLQLLRPNQEATRADIANLLYQALVLAGEAPTLPVK